MASDIIVFLENVTREEVEDMRSELPSDIHLIEYLKDQELFLDAVRAYKKSEIFDFYYDMLNESARSGEVSTFEICSITNGHGSIKPKLFNQ